MRRGNGREDNWLMPHNQDDWHLHIWYKPLIVFFSGIKGPKTLKLGSIGYSVTTRFVQMMTLSWPWPILQQGQIWSLLFLYVNMQFPRKYWSLWGEYRCTCSQIKKYMMIWQPKVKVIDWFLSKVLAFHSDSTLSKVTQIQHFKLLFLHKTLGRLKLNFIRSLHGMLGWKYVQMFRVTWPRWRPGPYMLITFKTPSKITFFRTKRPMTETWYTTSGTQVQPICSNLQACCNPTYPMHSGEQYRTNCPLVVICKDYSVMCVVVCFLFCFLPL